MGLTWSPSPGREVQDSSAELQGRLEGGCLDTDELPVKRDGYLLKFPFKDLPVDVGKVGQYNGLQPTNPHAAGLAVSFINLIPLFGKPRPFWISWEALSYLPRLSRKPLIW